MIKNLNVNRIILIIVVFVVVLSLSILVYVPEIQADSNDFYSGTWVNPTNFRCQLFSSAYPYWDDIDHGFNAWNFTTSSSKLWMRTIAYRADNANLGYEIRFYGVDLGPEGPIADALNYPSWTSIYTYSRIRLNLNRYPGYSQFIRRGVATHEVGHSLSLKHPDHTAVAIMNSPLPVSYNVPQTHDKQNIQAKYGQ